MGLGFFQGNLEELVIHHPLHFSVILVLNLLGYAGKSNIL